MTWAPTFNGFDLDDTNGVALDRVKDLPNTKMRLAELLADGVAVERFSRGGRKIDLSGSVKGSTTTELDTRIGELLEAFSDPSGGNLTLATGRQIYAYPRPGAIEVLEGASNLGATWSAQLLTESPFWESTLSSFKTKTLNAGVNTGTVTATNNGTAPVVPLIRIVQKTGATGTRDPLNLAVLNLSLSEPEYIRITNGALGNTTDRIILDPADESVYLENDSAAASHVPSRIDGNFFRLEPGGNTIYVDALTTGGELTITLYWNEQYHSSGY